MLLWYGMAYYVVLLCYDVTVCYIVFVMLCCAMLC